MNYQEEEKYDEMFIPENSEFDLNIGNFSFDTGRFFQGVIIAGIIAFILYLPMKAMNVKTSTMITFLILGCGGGMVLGIMGVNGDSVFGYIMSIISFNGTKRIAYYNPRIKKEIKFFIDENETNTYVIPREKIEAFYKKHIAKIESGNAMANLVETKFDKNNMYFEDDIEYLGKPEELMTKSELKKYRKEKKKAEKEKLKAERKEMKRNGKKERKKAVGVK